ncbi:MAG: enhanced intracellular survival protein Eis [Halanaeroarchaeum sp.]
MVEYRPIPDDRRDDLSATLSYAFSPENGPFEPNGAELPPPATTGDGRGLFDGRDLVSVCKHHWLDAGLRGETVPMAGLSAVATPPEHRRRGSVRTLLRESLREYRDREVPLAALWPFETPFYEQFGWATAFLTAVQVGAPDVFRIGDRREGRFYRADPDDWPALDRVLANQDRPAELAVDRSEEWWRKRTFHSWGTDPYVYVWERDGNPAGYVVYTVSATDDGKELRVGDLAFVDRSARRALLGFLADHDSQVDRVRLSGPADSVLLDRVEDPADLDVTLEAGAMVRIVDVVDALEAIDYPPAADGSTRVAVADPLVEWNGATFEFEVADREATVAPVGRQPAVEMGVGALSQLLVGYRSIDGLREAGDVRVRDESALDLLDAAFPESRAYLREWF